MDNPAHDLLLLLLNLTQQTSAERVRETFVEAVSSLFPPVSIRWLEAEEEFDGETLVVATLKTEFGRIAVDPANRTDLREALPLLRNAVGMLAVILEKFQADRLLADEKLLLQDQVKSRTAALQESRKFLENVADTTPDLIYIYDLKEQRNVYSNREVTNILGYSPGQMMEMGDRVFELILHPEDAAAVAGHHGKLATGGENVLELDYRLKDSNGQWHWLRSRDKAYLKDDDGSVRQIIGVASDITNRKAAEDEKSSLEEQLHQAQKMEAVGRLAGGVAHDFNNILTGIIGFTELSQATLGPGDPILADLDEIRKAADRAADLTAQLLAFSRKQIIHPMVIQPNDVLQNSQKMLRRIISEDIDLSFKPFRDLWRIKADTGQLDQILVNLAVNARDAMPDGGRLTIETQNVKLDREYSRTHKGMEPGDYVMLAVTDNGQGMDADTREHIFEPFYSTKGKDQGTGLGLSTVYGIMKQNNGFVHVYSEPGIGTTFKIYFPAVMEQADIVIPRDMVTHATGTETVLLVEDEEMVRRLAKKILEKHGYRVIEKDNGGLAMMWAEKYDDAIDLLLTDVIMPGMNGMDLLEKLHQKRPGLKALFMSGYTDNVIAHHGVLDEGTEFIQKPFSVGSLTSKVRDVLDR